MIQVFRDETEESASRLEILATGSDNESLKAPKIPEVGSKPRKCQTTSLIWEIVQDRLHLYVDHVST